MIIVFILLFGLGIGSFLNMVIVRLHHHISLFKPGWSICLQCRREIAWYDNIPLVSFLLLRGKCRACHAPISWQYPIVEVAMAVIATWLYLIFGLSADFFIAVIFSIFLLLIFIYDARYYTIPDVFSIPALVIALSLNLWHGMVLSDLALGVIIGGGFFLIQFVMSRGKWIGGGDIRLGAVMGAMLGWQLTIVALAIAYVVGAVIGIGLLLFGKKQMSSAMPFGTCLTAATFFVLLYGQQALGWYLGLIGLSL